MVKIWRLAKNTYLCIAFKAKSLAEAAQMAESVDALVSNTSGATRAGSTPALGTQREKLAMTSLFFFANDYEQCSVLSRIFKVQMTTII